MPRFILIDSNSGYIFGDTADLNGKIAQVDNIIEAAQVLDEQVVGVFGRSYSEVSRRDLNGRTGYLVYRADVNGSDAVMVVRDGQSREEIEAVERDCEYVGAVLCESAAG